MVLCTDSGETAIGKRICDPTCGSGRLLLAYHVRHLGNYQVADIRRSEELSVHLPTAFGGYCHEEVTERIKPSAGLQLPLHEPYPSGKHFHKMPVLRPDGFMYRFGGDSDRKTYL